MSGTNGNSAVTVEEETSAEEGSVDLDAVVATVEPEDPLKPFPTPYKGKFRRVSAQMYAQRVFAVLANPAFDDLNIGQKAEHADMKASTFSRYCSDEMIYAVMKFRRRRLMAEIPAIDKALVKRAKMGSLGHIELAYERLEGYHRDQAAAGVDETTRKLAAQAWGMLDASTRETISDAVARSWSNRHRSPDAGGDDGGAPKGEPRPAVGDSELGPVPHLGQGRPESPVQATAELDGLPSVRGPLDPLA